MDGRVDMCTRVLTGGEVVPIPGRAPVVIMADLRAGERDGVSERRGQLNDWRVLRQRSREVDHLDGPGADTRQQIAKHRHGVPPPWWPCGSSRRRSLIACAT